MSVVATQKKVRCTECSEVLVDPEAWPPICEGCRRQINYDDNKADNGHLGEENDWDW